MKESDSEGEFHTTDPGRVGHKAAPLSHRDGRARRDLLGIDPGSADAFAQLRPLKCSGY
jgi:hypothetical protein